MSSPTQRSKKLLEERGYLVAVVEKWIPHGKFGGHKEDLFGMFDLFCIPKEGVDIGVMGVQVTGGGNLSTRFKKIKNNDIIWDWLMADLQAEVHDWRKTGKAGKRKTWNCRIKEIGVDNLRVE